MNRAIIFGLGVLFASAAAAQQYKWVDQNGKTQYGDVPPPGVQAQRLKPPPAGTAPAPAPAAKKGDKPLSPEAAYRKRQEDAQKENEKNREGGAGSRGPARELRPCPGTAAPARDRAAHRAHRRQGRALLPG
jgi:hypothetical protein